ncbi:MAG: hypothetical protein AB7N80_12110 [Bdellovibrionales bacterium]
MAGLKEIGLKLAFWLCQLTAAVPFFTIAETYTLFQNGQPHRQYSQILLRIQPGDLVHFSNGKEFAVTRNYVLESGRSDKGSNAILGVQGGHILRLPKHCATIWECRRSQESLQRYLDGHRLLAWAKVPTPEIYLAESYLPEYLLQEEVEILSLLSHRLSAADEGLRPLEKLLIEALRKFFLKTAPFVSIGDFYADQVALTSKGVILLDWHDGHQLYSPSSGVPGLTVIRNLRQHQNLKTLLDSLESTIFTERQSLRCQQWLERTQYLEKMFTYAHEPVTPN